jgi:hypothetical protein
MEYMECEFDLNVNYLTKHEKLLNRSLIETLIYMWTPRLASFLVGLSRIATNRLL